MTGPATDPTSVGTGQPGNINIDAGGLSPSGICPNLEPERWDRVVRTTRAGRGGAPNPFWPGHIRREENQPAAGRTCGP